MANLAFAWVNRADAGTWTASGQLAQAPVSRLQNKHVGRKWRVNASTGHVVCDLGDTYSIDTLALIGLNEGTQPTRVRVSVADTSGVDGSAYDSGTLTDPWNNDYLPFVHLLSSTVIGRYVRFDLTTSATYIECGRGFIGAKESFTINFSPGWSRGFVDPSNRTIGRGGQAFDDLREKYRTLNLTLEFMAEANRWSIVEAIDIALGQSGDMLVMTDPDATDLSRDCIWGFNETLNPVTEPVIVADGPRFQRTYSIRERL